MQEPISILEGIRVVEVATFVFGPAAGTVMADFGADVIHVEAPSGDPHRLLQHLKPLPESPHNYPWIVTSRNKRSVALDLKSEAGHEALLALIAKADVLITNYHASVLNDLGIRYEDLAAAHPRLVYAHATGFGERGDESERPGYDATAWWARSGLMDAVRTSEDGEPALAPAAMGDQPSAMALLSAIFLGLFAREHSGKGTKVSSSLIANGAWSNALNIQAAMCGARFSPPVSRSTTPNALVNHYESADGHRFYLVLVKEAFEWEQFCRAIDRPDLQSDERFAKIEERRRNAPALAEILATLFRAKPLAAWIKILDENGITFGRIMRSEEVPHDPQMRANGLFPTLTHPELGELATVDSPIQIRGARKRTPSMAPTIGQHTEEALREVGFDPDRLAD